MLRTEEVHTALVIMVVKTTSISTGSSDGSLQLTRSFRIIAIELARQQRDGRHLEEEYTSVQKRLRNMPRSIRCPEPRRAKREHERVRLTILP
jgi:hypothetical protein